jgi:hypothetical protein
MDEDQAAGDALCTASMTALCRRKRGDTDESSDSSDTESDSEPQTNKTREERSVKRLRFGDHRLYDRECSECSIASSAFMETVRTHLKNTEDNQRKAISLLEKLIEKA